MSRCSRWARCLGFNNTNSLVRAGQWDIQLSKTGFIREAGKCLVMLANIASRPVVIVLLDSYGRLTRIADAVRVKYWLETGESLPAPQAVKAKRIRGTLAPDLRRAGGAESKRTPRSSPAGGDRRRYRATQCSPAGS